VRCRAPYAGRWQQGEQKGEPGRLPLVNFAGAKVRR
jgi:hypothetical protein